MATPYTSKKLVTSDEDLKTYIKKHPRNYELIDNGMSIFPYSQLKSFPSQKIKTKMAIIINTLDENELTKQTGHWTILLKFRNTMIFIDPLTQNIKNTNLHEEIENFAKRNKCMLFTNNIKTQSKDSNCCGFFVIFFLNYFAKNSKAKFVHMLKILSSHSLALRENYILSKAYKLCKL